ncbi:hypothetical protein BH24ACT21_BH24ACT21_03730 [soil metagenome]
MSDPEQRNTEDRHHLDLEHQRKNEVSRSNPGQVPQNNYGYVKLAMGVVFLAAFGLFGISLWFLIPAAILIGLGLRDLNRQRDRSLLAAENNKERELLSAIRDNDYSITPAEAAMEISLTVREADEMLSELAGGGHLQVESQDGALYYSLPGKRTKLGS